MADDAPPKTETIIAGVPLRQYVAIYAAVGEGFSLEQVLLHEGLDLETWPSIDRAWADALVQSTETDLTLVDAHDSLLLRAQDRFWRAIPPISEKLDAWLDFFRVVSSHDDPFSLLAEIRVRPSDVMRLQRHWSDRVAEDPALREETLAILNREPAALPRLYPEPARLPPAVGGGSTASPDSPVDPPSGDAALPPLVAPLPTPASSAGPARDSGAMSVPTPAPSTAPLANEGASVPEGVALLPPAPAGAKLGLISYASACAEAMVHPDRAAGAWAKYGLAGLAIEGEHIAWRIQFDEYPEERAEFELQLESFKRHWAARASIPPPVASSPPPPARVQSSVPPRSMSPMGQVVSSAPTPPATIQPSIPPRSMSPIGQPAAPPTKPPVERTLLTTPAAPPTKAPVERTLLTSSVSPFGAPPGVPTPSPAGAAALPPSPKLNLMAYASACAWVAVHPQQVVEAWSRYGLAGDAIRVEHAAWHYRFSGDPALREEFEQQLASFKKHWATRR